jgi:hypothetical protein
VKPTSRYWWHVVVISWPIGVTLLVMLVTIVGMRSLRHFHSTPEIELSIWEARVHDRK